MSSAKEVKGICAAVTLNPFCSRKGITLPQDEPSAQAPCTRTMFVFDFIFSPYLLIMSILNGHFLPKKLLVAPRFFDHLRKHSLAQPSLKRSLGVLQQLCHCLFMSATRAARLFFWILVNRKNRGHLYCFVNFQQTDLTCWPRQR